MPSIRIPAITWRVAVWADTWKTTPFVALLLLAGLQNIPADLYEAAALEGAKLGLEPYAALLDMKPPGGTILSSSLNEFDEETLQKAIEGRLDELFES